MGCDDGIDHQHGDRHWTDTARNRRDGGGDFECFTIGDIADQPALVLAR
jgi:hypothetical protein